MKGYLGEFDVFIEDSPFADYMPVDWALYYIDCYAQIDGAHHKQWVLDQVARILHGTKVYVRLAKWDNGHEEFRVDLEDPSESYKAWVELHKNGGEYDYDEGIAP